ncbi:MAG: pyrroline-5-carboxylate reductase [Clostridia bacterium]|nr:pyrroline-5-carboxylate reductase [Clostridia bacterium]
MKVGFVGCGNMGGALARAVSKVDAAKVYLFDKDTARAEALAKELGGEACGLDVIGGCDFVFLGVKPNIISEAAAALAPVLSTDCVVISMAAGVAISKVEAALGGKKRIIRIMPNTPVAYSKGMILYALSESVSPEDEQGFLKIMTEAGRLDRIPEGLIDAGSAVSGCGPAFVYMFIEALADGGVASGLPRDRAMQYAAETVLGAATVVLKSGKHPGELKDAVCSPGGSTIEGVLALEEGGMRGTVADAVVAAYEKTKKLGK